MILNLTVWKLHDFREKFRDINFLTYWFHEIIFVWRLIFVFSTQCSKSQISRIWLLFIVRTISLLKQALHICINCFQPTPPTWENISFHIQYHPINVPSSGILFGKIGGAYCYGKGYLYFALTFGLCSILVPIICSSSNLKSPLRIKIIYSASRGEGEKQTSFSLRFLLARPQLFCRTFCLALITFIST